MARKKSTKGIIEGTNNLLVEKPEGIEDVKEEVKEEVKLPEIKKNKQIPSRYHKFQ